MVTATRLMKVAALFALIVAIAAQDGADAAEGSGNGEQEQSQPESYGAQEQPESYGAAEEYHAPQLYC